MVSSELGDKGRSVESTESKKILSQNYTDNDYLAAINKFFNRSQASGWGLIASEQFKRLEELYGLVEAIPEIKSVLQSQCQILYSDLDSKVAELIAADSPQTAIKDRIDSINESTLDSDLRAIDRGLDVLQFQSKLRREFRSESQDSVTPVEVLGRKISCILEANQANFKSNMAKQISDGIKDIVSKALSLKNIREILVNRSSKEEENSQIIDISGTKQLLTILQKIAPLRKECLAVKNPKDKMADESSKVEIDKFITFDQVKSLGIGGAKLKDLVDEGEIRAFRDTDKMKFRVKDIIRAIRAGLIPSSALEVYLESSDN